MPYIEHTTVKPQDIVDTGVETLRLRSVASNLVTRAGFEKFTGQEGDTVNVRVKGTLPVRTYAWRNDRSEPLKTDVLNDTVVPIKVELDRNYTGVKLIDEAKLFDWGGGWGDIFDRQTDALVNYNEAKIAGTILGAPFEVVRYVKNSQTNLKDQADINRDPIFNAFVDAKADLKKLRAPGTGYVALVGASFAAEIQKNQKLVTAEGNGDSALASATVGTIAGVTIVEDPLMPDDEAVLFIKSGYVFYNAAPIVPQSVPYGAATAKGGFALRWLMDYDTSFATDRSLFDTFVGYDYTKDLIEIQDEFGRPHVSTETFFTRGVKLVLDPGGTKSDKVPGDGKSDTPGGNPESYLALAYNKKNITASDLEGRPFPGVLDVPGVLPSDDAGTPDAGGPGS